MKTPHPGISSSSRAASSGAELDPGEPSARLLLRPSLSILRLVSIFFPANASWPIENTPCTAKRRLNVGYSSAKRRLL